VVWSYPEPMHDAEAVRGLLCFAADTVYAEGGARSVLQLEPQGDGWVGLLCLALTPESGEEGVGW
jgi:hypothetical protein